MCSKYIFQTLGISHFVSEDVSFYLKRQMSHFGGKPELNVNFIRLVSDLWATSSILKVRNIKGHADKEIKVKINTENGSREEQPTREMRSKQTHGWPEALIWRILPFEKTFYKHTLRLDFNYVSLLHDSLQLHSCTSLIWMCLSGNISAADMIEPTNQKLAKHWGKYS